MNSKMQLYQLVTLCVSLALSSSVFSGARLSDAPASVVLPSNNSIIIVPDQMSLSGDVSTQANTVGHCTEGWLSNTPAGSIILGVDPLSCQPTDWDGASISTQVFLDAPYTPTLYVLKLSWPDREGKGLHSPKKNQTAVISLDGHTLWGKRTTQLGTFNDYYGAEHESILTTIVVTQSMTHTLTISVPPQTAWDLSEIKLTAYPYPPKIQGIGYSPYRDCQIPGGTALPSTQNIQDDLWQLFHTANAIRTYAATGVNQQIPALAKAQGLQVFAGAWLDNIPTDEAEIQALITIANTVPVDGVIVGNEYYLRHRTDADIAYLLQRINQVKSGITNPTIPIMTAEIDNLMFLWGSDSAVITTGINPAYKPILDQTDYVLVHIYPFWSGLPIDGAAAFTVQRYKAMQAQIETEYPGQHKRVIIGETGWPSAGNTNHAAVPSPENQERYMKEFMVLAEQQGVEYMYFDAFDELWKIKAEGVVGQNWGYSYSDRTAKYSFYGVLIPAGELSIDPPPYQIYLPLISQSTLPDTPPTTYPIYTEWLAGPGDFVPAYIGDYNDISMDECDRSDPFSGEMAIRASYLPTGTLGWAGASWQYPANNHGDQPQGMDLSWANKVTFRAKGALGGEKIQFSVGGAGTAADPYPESLRPAVSTGFLSLSSSWQTYTINLRGKDLTHIITGFGWSTTQCANPAGATFYLDDIQFEFDANMPPPPTPGPVFPVYTDAAAQENHYVPSGWMGDAATPGRVSLTECWADNPHSGATSIRVAYTQTVMGWAGTYWVHPAENWGDRPGGYDLTGAKRLTFWARSEAPTATVTFLVGGVGYGANCSNPIQPYPDSVCPKIEKVVTLSSTWTKYTIDLLQAPQRNLADIVGGFDWVADHTVTFYLDDIIYEFQ